MAHGTLFYNQIRSGGAVVKTANYPLTDDDGWRAIIHNSASTHTFTLPNPVTNILWKVYITNIGAGNLTISRNSLTIDGVSSDITIPQFGAVTVFTDGNNYFTDRGLSGLASPLTTKGDLWGWDTNNARIPVGANGNVLTADSTQALGINWAAAGGGGGALTQITRTVLAVNTASVNFSAISGSYSHLQLVIVARCAGAVANDGIEIKFNTIATATYSREYIGGANGGTSAGQNLLVVPGTAALALVTGANAAANEACYNNIFISDYARTTFNKAGVSHVSLMAQGGFNQTYQIGWSWASTAAITQIDLTPAGGSNFLAGSTFTLYGIS